MSRGRKYLETLSDVKKEVGSVVYWNRSDSHYVYLCKGVIDEVDRKNVLIDGDWKWFPDLKKAALRTFMGEPWEK